MFYMLRAILMAQLRGFREIGPLPRLGNKGSGPGRKY